MRIAAFLLLFTSLFAYGQERVLKHEPSGLEWTIPVAWQGFFGEGAAGILAMLYAVEDANPALDRNRIVIVWDDLRERFAGQDLGTACPQIAGREIEESVVGERAVSGIPACALLFKDKAPAKRHRMLLLVPRSAGTLRIEVTGANERDLKKNLAVLDTVTLAAEAARLAEPPPDQPRAEPRKPTRVRVSQAVSQKNLVEQIAPEYPAAAKRNRIEGTVKLYVRIGRDGSVAKLVLLGGDPLLTQSAVAAVSKWKYRPYMLQGEPVEVETLVTVNYRLR